MEKDSFNESEYSENDTEDKSSTTWDVDTMDSIVDVEQEIINIINDEIKSKKSSLAAVISFVEHRFRRVITTCDAKIISIHYISICERFWKEEIRDYLKEIEQIKDTSAMQYFLATFMNMENLQTIHEPLKNRVYYKLLSDHFDLISEENILSLIWWYKHECYQCIKNSNDTIKKEINFLEALIRFLKSFKSINSSYLLQFLNDFCLGKISVNELIAKIESIKDQCVLDSVRDLRVAASSLECINNLYLEKEFKAVLASYTKEVKITQKNIDARSIIEITGTYIVVSKCLKFIEQILQTETVKGTEVHEVHFVGTLVVHIDTDLNNEIWHGRNIVVCTRMVNVHGSVTWNVSGKNADHIYSTKAGTDDEGNGIHGKDGYPGESGGNVLFITDKIENSAALKIFSNGGNGSNGQDGGDGRDGQNGTGISKNSIDERFPPPCCFKGKEHFGRVRTIIKSIQSAASSVKTAWIDGSTMSLDTLIRNYNDKNFAIADIFIEGKTNDGKEIVFSSDSGLARQSFFLCKGTNGTSGHMGGNYGLGGQGGFAGAIMIESLGNCENKFVIQTEVVVGTDGKSGKKGMNGKSGKNGWDMGYLDYFTWSSVKYYGTSENEKLRLERLNNSTSTNVWSEYYDRYVGFKAKKIEHPKQTTYETSATCATERQHYALAVNKKTVSKQSILDQYSLQMKSLVDNTKVNNSKMQQHVHHVDSMVTKIGETLTKQIQNKKQQQAVFKTARHCKYSEASEHSVDDLEDELLYVSRQAPIEPLVSNLAKHPSFMHYWFKLTNIQLDDLELNRLRETIKNNCLMERIIEKNNKNLQAIKSILDEKYRLVVLKKIAENMPVYLNVIGDTKIQAKSATKFLIKGSDPAYSTYLSSDNTWKQYLWNDDSNLRKQVFQFCIDTIKSKGELWSTLMRTFFEENTNPTEKVNHLHEKYQFYAHKSSQELIVFKESFEKLDKISHNDVNLMKELEMFLLEQGPISKSYRLLLANMLNVNIRTYMKDIDDENKFSLSDNQNPEANAVMYLLLTDDGLHEIFLDNVRLEMEIERRLKSQIFYKILTEIEPLRGKQEFDEYFHKLSEFIEKMNGLTRDDLYEVENSKTKRTDESQERRKSDKTLRDPFKCASFENLSEENSFFRSKNYLSCPDILKAYEYTGLYLDQIEDLNEIMKYFPEEREKQEITKKFHKISQFIGYPEIVHNIQRRFACEGRHVSYEELSCLINSVLSTFTDCEEHLNIVSWIAAAFSQQNWIDELLLMKIEDFLKMQIKDKKKWRAYLSNIENKKLLVMLHEKLDALPPGSSVTYQCFAETFVLLSKIPSELLHLDIIEWPLNALREMYRNYTGYISPKYEEVLDKRSTASKNQLDLLISNLAKHPSFMHYWFKLTNIQLDDLELNRLRETINNNCLMERIIEKNNKNLQAIKSILDEKYRLVVLKKIAENMPVYLNVIGDTKIQAKSATKFLIKGSDLAYSTYLPSDNTWKQYLWNDDSNLRKQVFQFCIDTIKSKGELWSTLMRTFFEENTNPTEKVKHLHEKYQFYAYKSSQELIVFKESFEKLDKISHNDVNLMKELEMFLLEQGPISKSYRLLLANMLNVNIRTYMKDIDDENKFSLSDNYNPDSEEIVYLLLTEDGLLELSIDRTRLEIEVERRLKSQLFYKILTEVEPLREKKEFDDYFLKLFDFIEKMNNLTKEDLERKIEASGTKLSYKHAHIFKCPSLEDLTNEDFIFTNKSWLSCSNIFKAYKFKGLYLDQMDDLIEITKYFTEDRERQEIEKKFQKISQYTGYPEIVHNIQRRFACEGRHVSYEELSCLINSVLSTFTDCEEHLNIVSWIAAAFSQQNWIDELLLMKIEYFLKMQIKDKIKWRAYLSNIENKKLLVMLHEKLDALPPGSSVTYQCFAHIFYLLSEIPHESFRLESVDISEWPYVLREKYWMSKISSLVDSQANDASDNVYYLLSIENTYGAELTEQLVNSLQKVNKHKAIPSTKLELVFCNFHNERWILNASIIDSINASSTNSFDSWIDSTEKKFASDGKIRNIEHLIDLIENNGNTSKNIIDSLPSMSASISYALKVEKTILSKGDVKICAKSIRDAIRQGIRTIRDSLGEILYVIDKAIELERGITLRDTQKLAILSLTSNSRNTLAQVSTGEGKSLIVAATAIIKALQGKKVHIVTSSTVLAKRDAEENAKIFNIFDVYASHNCNENIEKRKEAYSNNQVIYGDLGNFQRDYLLDRFYGKRVLGDHDLENVIIDEVDSMLLDKGNNMLYLSHNLAGFDKLEPVYIFIWQWITRPAADSKELSIALDTSAIKKAVLDEIYIRIHKTEIYELCAELDERQKLKIWTRMIDANIIDEGGKLSKENITETDIDGIVPSNLECSSSVKYRLVYILNECIDRIRFIAIPNYLKPFVEQHLECWIRSAVTAFFMKSGEDYVVDLDNTDTSQDRNPNIIIIDRDTGTDLVNSQWDEALYQFLQLKHGCKISLQNLKAVFISNVSYFKKYKTLNGLTGTLGTKRDRDLLQEIHDVDYVIIPTAQSKLFHEEKSIVSPTKEGWKKQILYETKQITNEQKRSVLIICETVNMVNDLYQLFGGRKETHVHTYTRDYEQFEVAKKGHKLHTGQIIIATNLAGRGTDIKISDELNQAGGLHVILTYLPNNIRIEQQAFGRAARCGAKGSGKLIIFNSKGQESVSTKILELKTNRHTQEMNRLAECKVFYDVQITAEEECFEKFNAEYGRLKRDLASKEVPNVLQDLLLESCLDKWAYWLDVNSKWIKTSHNSLGQTKYQTALKAFIQQLKILSTGGTECSILDKTNPKKLLKKFKYDSKFWIEWVKDNPPQMVKLGKYLSQNLKEFNNSHETAIELFDGVIRGDPNFAEVARYYKASVLIKKVESGGESIINSVKRELRLSAKLFEKRIEQHSQAASIIGNIKSNNTESLIEINAFEDQQCHFIELYNEFKKSINNILGQPVWSDCFVSQIPSINKQLANAIFAELLHKKVIKHPMVGKELIGKDLKVICGEYGVSVNLLQNTIKAWGENLINENEFIKHLEQYIPIPNRRQFWTMLVEKDVLCDNKEYVAIQTVRLEGIDTDLIESLLKQVKKEHKEDLLNLGDGQQLLYADWTELEKDNELIFENECFRQLVSQRKYEEWNELEALSFNKKANINRSQLDSVRFDAFDSIRPEDFANVGIVLSEAESIIAELVKQNILVKDPASKDNVYRPTCSVAEISDEQFTFFAGYKQIVKQLLSCSFAYRIAFDNIVKCLKEGISQTELDLTVDPYRNLMMNLFEKHILVPSCVNSKEKALDTIVKKMCKNSSSTCLNNAEIIKFITNKLNEYSSSLERLEVSDGSLKPLPGDSGLTEEQQIFELNGLNCLLQCDEKKWTNTMLRNTLFLSYLAIGQAACGMVTEGINDIIFAIRALQTGYFSWTNYRNQKLKSFLVTICTAGLFNLAKRGYKFLSFATKVCKTAQGQATKIVAQKEVASITKQVIVNAASRIALELGNDAIENIVQTHLHSFCKEIASSITSDINEAVESHPIAGTLRQAFDTLGEAQARQIINNCTSSCFNQNSEYNIFTSTITDIGKGFIGKCVEALSKSQAEGNININSYLVKIISTLPGLITSTERLYYLSKIKSESNSVLNNINENIEKILKNQTNIRKEVAEKHNNTGYDNFKKEIINEWKMYFNEKAGRVVETHLVTPLLQSTVSFLAKSALKLVKNGIRAHKFRKEIRKKLEKMYREHFEKLKGKYKKQKRAKNKKYKKSIRKKIKKRYHKSLLKLMMKTRSPELMADLVTENVKMEATCLVACLFIVKSITKQDVKFLVEGPDGKVNKIALNSDSSANEKIIRLKLKDNHFTLCDESMKRSGDFDGSNNSCLYVAMMQAIPEMNMSKKEFRKAVANCIRNEPSIRKYIKKGYHHKLLAKGLYGGSETKKGRTFTYQDVDSTGHTNGKEHKGDHHLYSRFIHSIRFKGVIDSAWSAYPDLDFIVKGGGSTIQDLKRGNSRTKLDSAHLSPIKEINKKLYGTVHYEILTNMAAKTQKVHRDFNRRKVARDLDSLITNWLATAPPIMKNGQFTVEGNALLVEFKKEFIIVLQKGYNNESNSYRKQTYQSAIEKINAVTESMMRAELSDGFNFGPKTQCYMNKASKPVDSKTPIKKTQTTSKFVSRILENDNKRRKFNPPNEE